MRHPPLISSSGKNPFYRTKRRDYVLPFLAAALVLVGSFRLVSFADLSDADNVSKFQISFGFIALGYLLSWHFAKRLIWLMLLVSLVARIAVSPIESGDTLNRRLWDSRIFAAEHNPYELAPSDERLEAYRDANWEGLTDRDKTSSYLPGMLWFYSAMDTLGDPSKWMKSVLIVADLLLCLLFALRFGADRATLYAWNPLVIYLVGGLGVDAPIYLLPLVGGYLIWDFWIDQKGGVSVISASGGIGSAIGQMVCVSALLMGIGVSMNLIALPILLWVVWHVLRRSGIRAGLVTLVFGLSPLVLSLMWASISLNLDLSSVIPPEFQLSDRGVSLIPGILSFLFPSSLSHGLWYLTLLGLGALLMIHRCESIERFSSFYLIWMIALATAVFPWTILLLAIVGVGHGNYVFRIGSLSYFAYFSVYRVLGDTGSWEVPWTVQALVWIPLLLAALHYTIGSRHRDGFYVHHF
ncbi:hypothetical protein [Pelagicoccus sp. SDUM812003]|uniref:hypothetical protein n=1 Tax=Pelagicoccus sp. SDUM812003 TaxID=3041267 RepID=UPI00280EADC1|nr:hypothetical protein [Pelagicoccus sp. SDUM812003]MDQ8203903.1 hypothetical protein [Pelagicoccus sp. SDUM812003]